MQIRANRAYCAYTSITLYVRSPSIIYMNESLAKGKLSFCSNLYDFKLERFPFAITQLAKM